MKLMLRIFVIVSVMIFVDNPWVYVGGGALIMVTGILAFMEGLQG